MAQATPSISRHTPLTLAQHMTMATMTRAMQLARGAVKEQLKRERIRLAEVEAKEITSRARDFLKTHPALIAEAKLQIEIVPEETALAEKDDTRIAGQTR
jgi:hypothetical protein